jgi:hypothetical protein
MRRAKTQFAPGHRNYGQARFRTKRVREFFSNSIAILCDAKNFKARIYLSWHERGECRDWRECEKGFRILGFTASAATAIHWPVRPP